jgi:fused signal recognition particle receptor
MTAPSLPALPAPPASLVGDAAVLSRYGEVLVQAMAPRVPGADGCEDDPRSDLVEALSRLALALQAGNPARLRRQTGWWGRLLGRDVERQADADALQAQCGVLLLTAQAHARRLGAVVEAGTHAAAADLHGAQALEQWAEAGTVLGAGLPTDAQGTLHQRVVHLRTLASLKRMQAGQTQLLQAQDAALLDHFQRIAEVLVPAWQQAVRAGRTRTHARQNAQAAQLLGQIRAEVAAAHARLP